MPPPYATDRPALERDSDVEFYTASGPGGQHRNKTQSGVRLYHRPSGVRVAATERRSQSANLDVAFERLARAVARLNFVPKKRHATRVPFSQKKRRTDEKIRTGKKKQSRGRVRDDD
jgi:protein subunit release factor B